MEKRATDADRERSEWNVRGRKKTMEKEIMFNSPWRQWCLEKNNNKMQFEPGNYYFEYLTAISLRARWEWWHIYCSVNSYAAASNRSGEFLTIWIMTNFFAKG